MRHLFGRGSGEVLEALAHTRCLLAFDFDGTLAPIVADRDAAGMRAETRSLLARVAEQFPTAVISGRSERDVRARVRGVGVRWVIGNHGLEPGPRLTRFEDQVEAAEEALRVLLSMPGVDVENKRYSLAVHYRRSRQKAQARRAILAAASQLPAPFRTIGGKLVVNLVPEGAANKGDALLLLREQAGADTALYVGDDVTDEDVFRLDQPGRLVTVRVGLSKSSAASYFLRDQREIDRLLRALGNLRAHRLRA
jgi:trehalose 6-phosphate phosphatase